MGISCGIGLGYPQECLDVYVHLCLWKKSYHSPVVHLVSQEKGYIPHLIAT